MSTDEPTAATDLIHWTFTVPVAAVAAVQGHLTDLGADVYIRDEQNFLVIWEEPEYDLDSVVESVWSLVGEPFEITQEEFHRLALHILQHEAEQTAVEEPAEFHPGFDALDIREL